MRFRTIFLLVTFGLVALFVAALVPATSIVIDRSLRQELEEDLQRSRQALLDQWELRNSLYESESRVVADEPRVKSLAATSDIDHPTVLGVAQDLHHAMGQDLLLLCDAEGRLLADVTNPDAHGDSLTGFSVVTRAMEEGHASDVWMREDEAYTVHARQIRFGRRVEGLVVIGYRIGDDFAASVHRQTGSPVVVMSKQHVVASSLDRELERLEPDRLAAELQKMPADGSLAELQLGPDHYLTNEGEVGEDGGRTLRFATLRSLDRALEPSRQLKAIVYQVAAGALVLAAIAAIVVARRLSRPLVELVDFTDRVGAGDLDARASVHGSRESRTLGEAMNRMVAELDESRDQLAAKERLEREIEIASRLQTSLLPPDPSAPELDIAASMAPATEVGGDYYDVMPAHGNASWLAIGDVAGHGLPAGLVMFMAQVGLTAILRERPEASPAQIVCRLNELLYRNIRQRLGSDEHMTFMLMKHEGGGRFVHAGAHEDMLVYRVREQRCELVQTSGTWLGGQPDITAVTDESRLELETGDLLVLITDGMFEVRNAQGKMLGMERFRQALEGYEGLEDASPDDIRRHLMDASFAWAARQHDDLTLMVVRYRGSEPS